MQESKYKNGVISEAVNSSCSSELVIDKKVDLPPSRLEHNTEVMDNTLDSTVCPSSASLYGSKPARSKKSAICIERRADSYVVHESDVEPIYRST